MRRGSIVLREALTECSAAVIAIGSSRSILRRRQLPFVRLPIPLTISGPEIDYLLRMTPNSAFARAYVGSTERAFVRRITACLFSSRFALQILG